MGYDPDWEAGGLKSVDDPDVKLVGNLVHDNRGPGLWSDGACLRTTYRGNHITDNWGAGIQHEISYDALIERNDIAGNGRRHKGWAWEAGIQIQSSGGLGSGLIVVRRNTVADNAHGIMVLESGQRLSEWPATHGPHVVRKVLVRSNTVTLRPGQWTGVVQDVSSHAVFERGIRFRHNTYHLDSATQESFAWEDDELTWKQWRTRARQDRGGQLLLARHHSTSRTPVGPWTTHRHSRPGASLAPAERRSAADQRLVLVTEKSDTENTAGEPSVDTTSKPKQIWPSVTSLSSRPRPCNHVSMDFSLRVPRVRRCSGTNAM